MLEKKMEKASSVGISKVNSLISKRAWDRGKKGGGFERGLSYRGQKDKETAHGREKYV